LQTAAGTYIPPYAYIRLKILASINQKIMASESAQVLLKPLLDVHTTAERPLIPKSIFIILYMQT